jgi:hypothetical protein
MAGGGVGMGEDVQLSIAELKKWMKKETMACNHLSMYKQQLLRIPSHHQQQPAMPTRNTKPFSNSRTRLPPQR